MVERFKSVVLFVAALQPLVKVHHGCLFGVLWSSLWLHYARWSTLPSAPIVWLGSAIITLEKNKKENGVENLLQLFFESPEPSQNNEYTVNVLNKMTGRRRQH